MSERTILITGSADGIGKETAMQLAQLGAEVILHGRNREKGQIVQEEIYRKTGNDRLHFVLADLTSLRQVRNLAAQVKDSHDRLHVLLNNAGTFQPERILTEDGLETTFEVNYLAPFLLTHELLDLLKRSSKSRIINVASITHWNGRLDWANLQGERQHDGHEAYATSKLALILFTYALARRLEGTDVTSNCLHPGVIKTKLLRAGFGDYPGDTTERGAKTSVYLASSSEVQGITGKYFQDAKPVHSSPSSYDRSLQERLWKISDKLSGLD